MKYLFFDTECANCFGGKGKIYSFGFLETDEKFNIITPPQDLLINPDCKFDPYVKKNILVYDRAYLKTMPKFNEMYETIKKLMCGKDVICFGYGIENDLRFLADDCKRYSLPLIKAKIYDVQKLIKIVEDRPARKLDLEFIQKFGEQEGRAHRSDVDAVRTMMIAKKVCETAGKTPLQIYAMETKKANNRPI